MIRLYTNSVNIKLEMHSIRLQCQQFKLHRCATNLFQKYVQTSIKTGCVNYSTAELSASTNNVENQQFKAAVLQPKKQNLTLETLMLPEKAADGMVRNRNKQIRVFPCIKKKLFFYFSKFHHLLCRFVSASITAL